MESDALSPPPRVRGEREVVVDAFSPVSPEDWQDDEGRRHAWRGPRSRSRSPPRDGPRLPLHCDRRDKSPRGSRSLRYRRRSPHLKDRARDTNKSKDRQGFIRWLLGSSSYPAALPQRLKTQRLNGP